MLLMQYEKKIAGFDLMAWWNFSLVPITSQTCLDDPFPEVCTDVRKKNYDLF